MFRDGRYRMVRRPLSGSSPEQPVCTSDLSQQGADWMRNPPGILYWMAAGGSSSCNGAPYREPIGNGERFVVLRSAPVTGRDHRINVMLNWQVARN